MLFFLFYFVQPTENPRWKLWEHFCICKIIIVNRKVLQIWKLWPQFICLYFGISQFNWERREAIAVYFLSTNFLSIKVLINILKFPDDVTSSLCSSLWIHHPQVSIPGAIVSPSNPGIRGNMKDVRSDLQKNIQWCKEVSCPGQNTSVGKGNGSRTNPRVSRSGIIYCLRLKTKMPPIRDDQICPGQHRDWAVWAEAGRERGGLPEQRGGQDRRQDKARGEPRAQVRSW